MENENEVKVVNENEVLEKRKEAIFNWLKKPYNLAFLGVMILAIALRLYYFRMTINQPLWWDEADYMDMARRFAFGLDFPFPAVRPVLFSLILAFFLRISDGEFLPRLFLLLMSVLSVVGCYYLGKELFNKKVGLIAATFMAVLPLNHFFTYRILVDLPSLVFFTFSALLFFLYFRDQNKKALYAAAVLIGLGTLTKLPTAALLFSILIYVLITERLNFLKKKELYIAAIIFWIIITPYIIWGYNEYHGFVITEAGRYNAPQGNFIGNMFNNLVSYSKNFSNYLSMPLFILFILGLVALYPLFIGFDMMIKTNDKKLKRDLYLILIFLIPLITVSFSLSYIEDRYILNIFPAIFIIAGAFMIALYDYLVKNKLKPIAWIFIIAILASVIFLQYSSTDQMIKGRLDSYIEVKQAGIWIKENSNPEDIVIAASKPQMIYYTQRKVYSFDLAPNKSAFDNEMPIIRPRYYVLYAYEKSPDWSFSYPQEKNMTPVQAYFRDPLKRQASLGIYEFNQDYYDKLIDINNPVVETPKETNVTQKTNSSSKTKQSQNKTSLKNITALTNTSL